MKYTKILLLLPALATLSLTSCVVPGAYPDAGVTSVGVSYGTYATLPPGYAGDAYYYGGRYYSGGRYESGRYHDHGRTYTNRYYHNGRYYYGGSHQHHGGARPVYHRDQRQDDRYQSDDRRQPSRQSGDTRRNMRYESDGRQPSWQSNRPGQPYTVGDRGM